jgi:hypothetical protein
VDNLYENVDNFWDTVDYKLMTTQANRTHLLSLAPVAKRVICAMLLIEQQPCMWAIVKTV